MTLILLAHLDGHPDNANRMTRAMLNKLTGHIRRSGDYPPLIVRPVGDRYQILDGHHRAMVLRQLGHTHAKCDVWQVDDEGAEVLLLTLNRLRGEDEPHWRGALLDRLSQSIDVEQLARFTPENAAHIRMQIEASSPPPELVEPVETDRMPQAITFFLTALQRARLLEHLGQISRDRTQALVRLLALDDPTGGV